MANVQSLNDMIAVAEMLGQEAGRGNDTQIRFMLSLAEGGYHGTVDLTKDKHGPGRDDAAFLYEKYTKAQTGATMFNAKALNARVGMSKARCCIKLGGWPHGGTGEPMSTINNLLNTRSALMKKPNMAGRLDDAANTLLRYARAQLKLQQLIDEDDLEEFCFKREPSLRGAEEILAASIKTLGDLYEGKAVHNTACDNSVFVKTALDSLKARRAEIAEMRRAQKEAVSAKRSAAA